MRFKTFAKRLYDALGYEEPMSEFTRRLFLMLLPSNEKTLVDVGEKTLKAYYTGRLDVAPMAKKIFSSASPRRFEIFLRSQNKAQELYEAFKDLFFENIA